ncbi:MAG: ABC transporter permease, partial [archaeon]|nr:ABC transporter permease [archaeon]
MNPFLEVPHYALRNLAQQGLRSYLTLLGVVIGIAAMVTLFSLGTGLNKAAEEQFETLGSNTLFLTPSARFQQGGGPLTNFKTLTPSFRSRIETLSEVESTLAPVAASG